MMGCHTRHLEVVEQVGDWREGGGCGAGVGWVRGGWGWHERKKLLHIFIYLDQTVGKNNSH